MADKQPAPLITPQMLHDWNACYSGDRVAELYAGRKALSPLQVCDLHISAPDRMWVVLRKEIIPKAELYELAFQFARAILPPATSLDTGDRERRRHAERVFRATRRWLRGSITDRQLLDIGYTLWGIHETKPIAGVVTYAAATDPRIAAYDAARMARSHVFDKTLKTAMSGAAAAAAASKALGEEQLALTRKVLVRLYGTAKVKRKAANAT